MRPFRDPKTKSKKAQPVKIVQIPKELPGLKAIIYDHDDPVTQLLFRGTASKWLGVGDMFEGWEILTIAPDSVQVTDHEETITLFPNRRGNSPD